MRQNQTAVRGSALHRLELKTEAAVSCCGRPACRSRTVICILWSGIPAGRRLGCIAVQRSERRPAGLTPIQPSGPLTLVRRDCG